MNVAKSLLIGLLLLPLLELVVFFLVADLIGLAPAFALLLLACFSGAALLRYAGGQHIARMRLAMTEGRLTALAADGTGGLLLLAGILLLIPGFITDVAALLLLVAPLRRMLTAALDGPARPRADGVVDLEPEQWRRVPDPALPDRRHEDRDT